ncbi:MAG TPA: hypothetical protein VKC64_03075 [Burkholderiales bacterium]|nr:hypothetical protein [Burkholderiales bacterium]
MSTRTLIAVLLGLAVVSGPTFAAEDKAGSADSAQRDRNAATDPSDHHCDSAVSLFYLGNPAATGGFHNNPWADCKPPGESR